VTGVKRMKHQEVEVQVTPMLDMAFQLLSFFILTYRPLPTEGQFSMNLLPSAPSVDMAKNEATEVTETSDMPALLRTLNVQVKANLDGTLSEMAIGENTFTTLEELKARLKEIVADKTLPFDQAVIQADPGLRYDDLMRVIDVFAGPEVGITKLSFNELGAGGMAL
jgi:biopolymer transport protein ExbD